MAHAHHVQQTGAAAGGWSDIRTLLKCYQHADDETLLEVMSHPKKIMETARMA